MGPPGEELLFWVRDMGIGIVDEDLHHFERYWQAKETQRRGTGLGLPIVRGLVEPQACPAMGCRRPGLDIELRLQASPQEMASASVRYCRNAACIEGIAPSSDLPPPNAAGEWGGAVDGPRGAIVRVTKGSSGWFTVRVQPFESKGPEYLPDGDRYLVEVRGATGNVLASLDRQVKYPERRVPDDDTCALRCSVGTLRGYPGAAPGLTCSIVACESGARFGFDVPIDLYYSLYKGTFTVCRNEVCSTNTGRPPVSGALGPDSFSGALSGVSIDIASRDNSKGTVTLTFREDPSLLANGDVYSLKDGAGPDAPVIFQQKVTYEERFPNSAECDVHPCRALGGIERAPY